MSESGQISRKTFVRRVALATVAAQIPWFVACDAEEEREVPRNLDNRQSVLDILFPSEGHGPGAIDVYADRFIDWILADDRLVPGENSTVVRGFDQLFGWAQEQYSKEFKDLSRKQQEKLVADMQADSFGTSWTSRILTIICEAMFTHPIYGGNPDRIGWEWVDFKPGQPEPKEANSYPQILTKVRE